MDPDPGVAATPPGPRLEDARARLRAAEQADTAERAKLAALIDRERQTQYALEQAVGRLRMAKGAEGLRAARAVAAELEHSRDALVRTRHDQEEAVKATQERSKAARLAVEALEDQATRLRRAVRHGEQVVGSRLRAVLEAEATLARVQDELTRARRSLADAQATLGQARSELAAIEAG